MEKFLDFVHFINAEKRFIFTITKSPETAKSIEDYHNHPNDTNKLLKYNGLTLKQFLIYIESNESIIKNEIQDVFDKQDTDNLKHIRNKLSLLINLHEKYRLIKFFDHNYRWLQDIVVEHPECENDYFKLSPDEKKQISVFLEKEKKVIVRLINTIRKLETIYPFKNTLGKSHFIHAFEFRYPEVNFAEIYQIVENSIFDCSYDSFKQVFSGKAFDKADAPTIKWMLKNPNDGTIALKPLIYFLKSSFLKQTPTQQDLKERINAFVLNSSGETIRDKNIKRALDDYTSYDINNSKPQLKVPVLNSITKIKKLLLS